MIVNEPMVILDISANTHKNMMDYFFKMIDEVAQRDIHNRVIFKGQLWKEEEGRNTRQDPILFNAAMQYAWQKYNKRLTASVFDTYSLDLLMSMWESMRSYGAEIPFIKIANRRELDDLARPIPRGIRILRSTDRHNFDANYHIGNCTDMLCVSKYPATMEDYLKEIEVSKRDLYILRAHRMSTHISDHTAGLDLWRLLQPTVWEKHLKLKDSTGLDAGTFAITPEELEEVLS